jgi:hypothetical protein
MPEPVRSLLGQMAKAGTREEATKIGRQVYQQLTDANIDVKTVQPVVTEIFRQVMSRARK